MKIKYPEKESEFEIQAKLFSELKQRGFDVRGEVSVGAVEYMSRSGVRKKSRCQLDLVVFHESKVACIIEVRNWVKKDFPTMTNQLRKYAVFGVPLIVCGSYCKIDYTLHVVESSIKDIINGVEPYFKLY